NRVFPDMIIARSSEPMDEKRREKIAFFCGVPEDHVIPAPDAKSIYTIPIAFEHAGVGDCVVDILSLEPKTGSALDQKEWERFVHATESLTQDVNIAVVGKYFATGDFVLSDAYISVIEAIKFSAYSLGVNPKLHWLNAVDFENEDNLTQLDEFDGVVVPGGFGETGISGKINVIQYARQNNIPYFGLCYGMQLLVVEYARNILGIHDANTVEIDPDTINPVIHTMASQKRHLNEGKYGGTMRLGAYPAILAPDTIAHEAYGRERITERHRHRYEVNNKYVPDLERAGLIFSGTSPDGQLMEIAELPTDIHPFFVGVQFHPEFLARPLSPHPLFTKFVEVCTSFEK
ncbi:MAG: CTP synthase, partial [Candidatus Nomurabacteria bacterium]|nr:CTP synthase [Candidatus Nomurabacteria bacterium]